MALKFYRNFSSPIRALSFDLDDTLYYNEEVIHIAEQKQFEFLCRKIPDIKSAGIAPWLLLKHQSLSRNPSLKHDVTLWRKASIELGLAPYKINDLDRSKLIEQAFNVFYQARSNFQIEDKTFKVLDALKSKYPLVAVTNGNADINRLGLADYFVGYYRAGANGNKMKPHPDMLNMAANHLDIKLSSILHIGDNIKSDLKSAQNAKTNSFWYNPAKEPMSVGASLPNAEYSDLDDLLQLL